MADRNATLTYLKQVPIFRTLPAGQLEFIVRSIKERTYEPGAEIVKQGEPGVGFFLIDKLTPYNLWEELVKEKNVALAIVVGCVSIGLCLIIAAAVLGEALHPLQAVGALLTFAGIGLASSH